MSSETSRPPIPFTSHGEDRSSGRMSGLEAIASLHVTGLLLFTAWDFGGETDLARVVISWWGGLAVPIAVAACVRRWQRRDGLPASLRWLLPLVLFDLVAFVSTLNPSFTDTLLGGKSMLVHSGSSSHWPSTAVPLFTLRALWQFNAIYLTFFNLLLVINRRRVLRGLLVIFVVNGFILAVMGTFQKLAGAPGLYFGLQPSPNSEFFATFIYHNHWGAYVLLTTAAALGLLFYYARHPAAAGSRHSPTFMGVLVTLFLAASVPLSASRSGSLMLLAILTGALLHWLWRLRRDRERPRASLAVLAMAVFLAGLGGIFLLDRTTIDRRVDTTRLQFEQIRLRGNLGNRTQLYHDTWRMARQKPWFGWGLGCYGIVFQMFNQQVSVENWIPYYDEAHSDWLQALADVGLVGTTLIVLMAAVPLLGTFRRDRPRTLPAYLLAGGAIIAVYALVEFPFANPSVMEAFWFCLFAALRYHHLTFADA